MQYQLLKLGIDSARMTTDAGVDLVVYSPEDASATTVQVKANLAPKPAGGKGSPSRSWDFPHSSPAQMMALVALDVDRVWLFTLNEAKDLAQQHSPRGVRKLYWRVEPPAFGTALFRHERDMEEFLLPNRAASLFAT